ncbi:MAG: VanZ family protein [Clostridiales Family XIII bacterium]|jgi:glycopeptide antibiotics resistance protein|nr:VanZ family protein [Clostridiales Family XIII bacterium]
MLFITELIPAGIMAFFAASLLTVIFHRKDFRTDGMRVFRLFVVRFLGLWYAFAAIALLFKVRILLLMGPIKNFNPFEGINLIPFETITKFIGKRNKFQWIQIWGNLFLLFPLPILLRLNFPKMKNRNFLLILIGVTVLIEPAQLLTNIITRVPVNVIDIDDFLLNAPGCMLGFLAAKLIERWFLAKKRGAAKTTCAAASNR